MRWDIAGSFIGYAIPAVLLFVAFVIKLPLLRRAWRDPILRATALLLGVGVLVFASLPPNNLHRINEITGVPNFAGVWVYSLLSVYCGACLWLIIVWREPPSAARSRRTRMVWVAYSVIILGLWVTFFLGDHSVERLRDLDVYYANTPWMVEHSMLYLVAHMVSAVVAASILWAWFKELANKKWLRRAVICLQAAYALGLIFDVAKIVAISARWSGRNLDWLSTYVAPPFAIAEALLVAVGFIVGQVGPFAEDRWNMWHTHRRLAPLWALMQTVSDAPAPATGRVSGAELQLEHRKARINDGLLKLAPHLSRSRREQVYRDALVEGFPEAESRAIAGAVDILVAISVLKAASASDVDAPPPKHQAPDQPASDRVRPDSELVVISHALRAHSATIDTFRRQAAATEGVTSHV
ncbi:MAB_1171c family putative transporter [Streptomyces sp. NPDC086549]|uniref:MAB_1171c family putative transporter n=1 Tax=Streptomyces sp. NPDC086549 TaxID=3365752 RepID=UPI00380BCCAC